jgi:heterodisulfide reductase subunit C
MVVLIACVTCAKAKARCDKKVSSEVGLIRAVSTRHFTLYHVDLQIVQH